MLPKVVMLTNNVWTLYRFNEDGTEAEQPFLEHHRPQDWGNSERWNYQVYTLDCTLEGQRYLNVVHCWAEMPISSSDHLRMFAGIAGLILMPSTPVEECSNTYLMEDDFWSEEWGPLPPTWSGDYEDEDDISG